MKATRFKFVAVLSFHVILFDGFLLLARLIPSLDFSKKNFVFAAFFSLTYFLCAWFDLYSRPYHHYLKKAFRHTFRDLFVCGFILFFLEYFFYLLHRRSAFPAVLLYDGLLVVYYFVMHALGYCWVVHLAHLGFFRKNVMLVGRYDERLPVEQLFQNINNTKRFIGQMESAEDGSWLFREELEADFRPIGKPFADFLFARQANELIICIGSATSPDALHECASWCRKNSIGYYLIPDIAKLPERAPWQEKFEELPTIEHYCPSRDSLIMISLKRLFDLFFSALGLILASPLCLAIAAAIKLEDGGPIFYVSTRIGIHGKKIRFVKFRSMVTNAEALKKELAGQNERPDGPLFKMKDDPRVTKVGRFLRRTSLDEIPQFWNVFKGDMSIIGPRPHLPEEVAAYSDVDNLRLECIPGISCLPQIRGRDSLGFREWVDLDLEYRRNWSIGYDFSILFQTAGVVLSPLLSYIKPKKR